MTMILNTSRKKQKITRQNNEIYIQIYDIFYKSITRANPIWSTYMDLEKHYYHMQPKQQFTLNNANN